MVHGNYLHSPSLPAKPGYAAYRQNFPLDVSHLWQRLPAVSSVPLVKTAAFLSAGQHLRPVHFYRGISERPVSYSPQAMSLEL